MGSVVCCRPCRFDDADDDDGDPYGPPSSRASGGHKGAASKSEYDALTREDAARLKKWLQSKGMTRGSLGGGSNKHKRQKSGESTRMAWRLRVARGWWVVFAIRGARGA